MLAQQKERCNKVGLTVSQWRAMASEAGHAVGMQYFTVRTKYCLGFSDEDQICLKIMVFSKKTVFNCNHSQISDFLSQKHSVLQNKKSSLEINVRFLTFRPKIIVFSKKKGFYLGSASDFSNSVPKPWCSLLSKKIKVITQNFVAHAKHDLQALTARHPCKSV